MALNVTGGDLHFVASLDTDQLEKSAKKAENSLTHLGDQAQKGASNSQKLFSSLATGILALGAAEKAFDFLGDSINEALDAEQATARFRNTLESINRADAFDRLMESADRLAQKFSYLDNDEVVAVFNKLVTYGKLTEKQMNDLLPVIINFSAKQRISIEQGSSIIIKALEGNTRSLKEYGINMKSTATETQRLETIMTQLKGKVDGAGEAFQNTVTGGVASARQEFKNLQEDIGTGLLPMLNKALSFISQAIKGLRGMTMAKEQEADNENIQVQGLINQKLFKIQEQINAKIINPKTGKPVTAEDYINALKEAMPKQDELHKKVFEGTIVALSKDKLGLDGVNEETKKVTKSNTELNSLLNDRKNILQAIKDIQNESVKTGLTDEQKQLKEISDRYDTLIDRIDEYNKKASKFGRPSIEKTDVIQAKDLALSNTRLKQDAERFKQSLQDQVSIFEQYENAKKEIGIEKANEMFAEQTRGYTSYLNLLKSEAEKIAPKVVFGVANIGDIEKMKFLTKAINDEEQKNQKEQFNTQLENYKRLLIQTASFNQQRLAYEKQYNEDVVELKKHFSGKDLEERLQVLKEAKQADLKNLAESIAAQTKGYRTLHQNLVNFTRERIKAEIDALEKMLSSSTLDNKTKRAIQDAIAEWKKMDAAISDSTEKLNDFIAGASQAASVFASIADSVEPFNKNIADSVRLMANLVDNTIKVAQGLKDFRNATDDFGKIQAATDIFSAIANAVNDIVQGIKKAKQAKKDADNEVLDFQTRLITGEQEYQALLRERARQIITNNKLTIQGLIDQQKLLETQKKETSDAFKGIFSQLQSESFVAGMTEKEKKNFESIFKGVAGLFGSKTVEAKEILQSLSGKSFAQLEELFTKGQLTGKAKELFEQLQKIKQEGVDIDQMLEENRKRAAEIFTGTTADSILDAITQGFAQGKRTVADFAGTFEEFMKQAILNSLKFKFLEGPINEFFEQFANAAESGGGLTKEKIADLEKKYNAIIENAAKKFEQLQSITGLNLSTSQAQQNVLQGSFRSLTEDTGNQLLGSFNGQRVATLQLLDVQRSALGHLNSIENNTANTVLELKSLSSKLDRYYRDEGVKMR